MEKLRYTLRASKIFLDCVSELEAELREALVSNPKFHSTHEGFGVLLEEVHELWDWIRSTKPYTSITPEMHKEAIQVAAMALRFIMDLTYDSHLDDTSTS